MLAELLHDHEALIHRLRPDLVTTMDKHGDAGTSDFLTRLMQKHEKEHTRRSSRVLKDLDFSDIPEVSPAQLRAMRRVGRPPLGAEARRLIAIRIDPQVLDAVRREAKRRGLGYQSLINNLLARYVGRARSA